MGPALRGWGVRCLAGFSADHLEPRPDLVVIGNVCRANNPEAEAAFREGIEVLHIAGALRRFVLSETSPLVVAGTHGKTTTSSMAAWVLDGSGLAPGFLIGGIPSNFSQGFRLARPTKPRLPVAGAPQRGVPFVIEGDEYDTAFFDKTPKFWHYGAEVAVLGSIEHDHIDIYPTLDAYVAAFRRFVEQIPQHGVLVANAADPLVVEVSARASCEVVYYALANRDTGPIAPQWIAAPAESSATATTFDLFAGGTSCGRFAVGLPGEHNVENATAALTAAVHGFGVTVRDAALALASFRGVRRRQEVIGQPQGVFVYDDFAHHPTAVHRTLRALRGRHASGRLLAVFEPRSATACRNLHQAAYAESFGAADHVIIAPLGRSGLDPTERLDVERLVSDLQSRGISAENALSVDWIVARLAELARPGDAVALLSNGSFGGIHGKLLEALGAPGGPAPSAGGDLR
jgi:UDP-N-acetylmuramate: L-alanyl-gamma-D-glutamyl-meso-diaminopimelate ligase